MLTTHCRFCYKAITQSKPRFCKASGVGDRTFCEKCGYRDYHLDKANIHTYLAWQDPPGKQLHDAVKQRILNRSHPQSANFLRWLQGLYEI
ncbi:DUF3226 domain-containing protein [Microcystis viridis]|uniref:DUF3226 domain-containing protein n=1 Tax=Microcystis viridis TaxID=44822 RepID=UPI002F9512DD